jgi:hypothetical protein
VSRSIQPTTNVVLAKEFEIGITPADVTGHRNLHLLPVECGYYDGTSRIIGGQNTSIFEFPWMVLLAYRSGW